MRDLRESSSVPECPAPPEPLASFDLSMHDGAVIRVRQHGNPTGPRLLLSHGNGFAIDGYLAFWRHFLGNFEVLVFDQRNHGRNPRHDPAAHHFDNFVEDLDRLLREIPKRLGPKPTAGVFHSLSAIASLKHAGERGWPWAALVLFDPPLSPPPDHSLAPEARAAEKLLSERAARRQERFEDPEELAEKFRRADPSWPASACRAMAHAVLRRCEDGTAWELACPRECEARVFAENRGLNLCPRLGELPGPVLFLCADPEAPGARMPARINRAMAERYGYPYRALPGTGHLLQLEAPDRCARYVEEFLAKHGFP